MVSPLDCHQREPSLFYVYGVYVLNAFSFSSFSSMDFYDEFHLLKKGKLYQFNP